MFFRTFFFDTFWDCPFVFSNLVNEIKELRRTNETNDGEIKIRQKCFFFNIISFINPRTWSKLIDLLNNSSDSLLQEEFFVASLELVSKKQINEDTWLELTKRITATTEFKDRIYFNDFDYNIISYIIDQAQYFIQDNSRDSNQENVSIGKLIESKLIDEKSIKVEDILKLNFDRIDDIFLL